MEGFYEGGEGLLAFKTKDGWMPLVGADFKRMESILPIAKELSKASGTKFRILQFDNRTDVTDGVLEKIKKEGEKHEKDNQEDL